MALVKCKECGKEISDAAYACPNCGFHVDKMKFCKFCGEKIPDDSVICSSCGRQVEEINRPNGVFINNSASASASASTQATHLISKKEKNKWISFFLCLFLGLFGAHKFYEGKIGMGIIYLFTGGLFFVGVVIDLIILFLKPNPYYV